MMKKTIDGTNPAPSIIRPPSVTDRSLWQRLSSLPSGVLSTTLFAMLIAAWEVGVRVGNVSILLVPAPSDIWTALVRGILQNRYLYHAWVTLQEILLGFGIAAVLALALALLVTQSIVVEKAVLPIVVVIQTIPKVALAPLLLTWFGFGIESKVATTALVAFFPILMNAILGLASADKAQINMMRSFGATRGQILRKLQIPNAMPTIFAGLDVAAVLAVIGAVVGEFVGSQAGLGYLIQSSNSNLDVAAIFAALVILSIIGLVLHVLVTAVGRRVTYWSESSKRRTVGEL